MLPKLLECWIPGCRLYSGSLKHPNHEHKNVRRLHAVWFCLSFVRSLIDGIWRLRHIFVVVTVVVVVVVVVGLLLFLFLPAPRSALCFGVLCWFSWLSAPFKNVVIWTPTETSSCRRCQSDSGRDSLTFWAAASLWLDTYTHTRRHTHEPGRKGSAHSLHLHLSSAQHPPIHPALPSLCSCSWCTARGRGPNSVLPASWRNWEKKENFAFQFKAVFRGFLRSQHAWAVS